MPIYDQTYRRYEARGALRQIRFWPITREALRLILAKRAFLVLLAVSWLPFLVRVVQIYAVTQFPEAGRILPVDGRLFGEFLNQQFLLTFLITIFGGAGLIANDLRTGAILVYLSRPLTRRDYIAGKLTVLLLLNLSVTLAPGLVLYAIGLALSPGQFLKWDLAWIGPAIVLQSFVISLVVSLVALAVSSLSRSARIAGLGFFGLVFGLEIVGPVLRRITDSAAASLLSIQTDLRAVTNVLFGVSAPRWMAVSWIYAALVLAVVCVACLAILRSRVRAVEIVR
jgi:ABC-2 type transport system permease protein